MVGAIGALRFAFTTPRAGSFIILLCKIYVNINEHQANTWTISNLHHKKKGFRDLRSGRGNYLQTGIMRQGAIDQV
jgi:hypothetical protein